jgi:hypothetical protein
VDCSHQRCFRMNEGDHTVGRVMIYHPKNPIKAFRTLASYISASTPQPHAELTSSEIADPITRHTFPTSFPGCWTKISFTPPIASLLTPELGCLNRKRTSSRVSPLELMGSPDGPWSTRSIGVWFGSAIATRQSRPLKVSTERTSSFERGIGRV